VTTLSLADWLNFSVASIEAENNVYRIGSWDLILNASELLLPAQSLEKLRPMAILVPADTLFCFSRNN